MTLYRLFCGVFLLSLTNTALPEQIITTSKDIKSLPDLHQDLNKKLLIASEGGPLTNTTVTLPKENHSMVLNLDTELVKNKTNSVVPRKGVTYNLKENNSIEQDSLSLSDMITLNESANSTETPKPVPKNNDLQQIKDEHNETKVHKPTVLSSQILDKLGEKIEFQPDAKVKIIHENSHPDLVMPIVITILVVPMFAVVGYMALKRGQEAWKNRHYKRMDFLLDGMYND